MEDAVRIMQQETECALETENSLSTRRDGHETSKGETDYIRTCSGIQHKTVSQEERICDI